jgi:hypothetical protein
MAEGPIELDNRSAEAVALASATSIKRTWRSAGPRECSSCDEWWIVTEIGDLADQLLRRQPIGRRERLSAHRPKR